MLFFAYFLFCLLLFFRSLILFFYKKNLYSILSAFLFLILALPLAVPALTDLPKHGLIKALLCALFIFIVGYSLVKHAGSHARFSWKKILFVVAFSTLGIVLFGINAIDNLTSEKPILLVKLTGKSEDFQVEWKMPYHPMQKAILPTYEVVLQSVDRRKLIFHTFLPGELCAVRAKIFRFHPLINLLGISNKYQLDIVYSGYFDAEKYAKFPVEACPISFPRSFFHSCLFKYWNSFFSMQANSYWIKSATLESNYFPLVDKKGKAFQGEFLLTISDSGLSAIAQKHD